MKFDNSVAASHRLFEPSGLIDESLSVSALELGDRAAQLLSVHAVGSVYAVFDRSLYVSFNEQLLCIGLPSIKSGPLNVIVNSSECTLSAALGLTQAVQIGSPVFFSSTALSIGGVNIVVKQHTTVTPSVLRVVSGDQYPWLLALETLSPEQWAPHSSLHSQQPKSLLKNALLAATGPAIGALTLWLRENFCSNNPGPCPRQCIRLLGAGPGATPSGDDLLMGVLLALHVLGKTQLKHSLWQGIDPNLNVFTNKISASFLRLAFDGHCNVHLRQVVEHVLQGGGIQDALVAQALDQMGGSSGWDTFYGVALVFSQAQACGLDPHATRHGVRAKQ